MLKVNLEQELIKQNKKILLPEELLSIKEYERLGEEVCENDVLSRIGINGAAKKGKDIKDKISSTNKKLAEFDPERVFHISQIESLCKRYYLKFLPSHYFNGVIDEHLANKISTFEVAHGVQMKAFYNSYIVAPVSSFKLEKRPKDPLLFYQIDEENYYLVHKWGNDLSIARRIYSFLSKSWVLHLIILYILSFMIYEANISKSGSLKSSIFSTTAFIYSLLYLGIIIFIIVENIHLAILPKNDWRSPYSD